MDPITAFGLACNVIQVVDFGLKTVSIARHLSKDGITASHDQLREIGKDLASAVVKLQEILTDSASVSSNFADPDDQVLFDLSEKCYDTATKLRAEVDKLTVTATGIRKVVDVPKKTVASWRKAEKLEELRDTLEAHRRALDTQILVALRLVKSIKTCAQDGALSVLWSASVVCSTTLMGHLRGRAQEPSSPFVHFVATD